MSENGENAIWLQFNFAVSEMLKSGSNINNSEVANMSTIKLERWDSKHGLNLIKPLIKQSEGKKRCFKGKKRLIYTGPLNQKFGVSNLKIN